jgi:hypothetical protein
MKHGELGTRAHVPCSLKFIFQFATWPGARKGLVEQTMFSPSAFLGWLILASLVGGNLCGRLEERLTGSSRPSGQFRVLRLRALLISYSLGLIILGVLFRLRPTRKVHPWLDVVVLVALSSSATVWIHISIYKRLLVKYLERALQPQLPPEGSDGLP